MWLKSKLFLKLKTIEKGKVWNEGGGSKYQ